MKFILVLVLALAVIGQMASAFALTVYHTDTDITSQVGGHRYWALNTSFGDGTGTTTKVNHNQNSDGSRFYRPGQTTSSGPFQINSTATGYGWATAFTLGEDVPAGTWTFQVATTNTRRENSPAYVGVNVFSKCDGTVTRLFYQQGAVDVASSTSTITQNISVNQSAFALTGCRLLFEWWLTIADVQEDNQNTLRNIDTSSFFAMIPSSGGGGGGCQDNDGDGYQAASCGGTDCNDANATIHPGATDVCNGVDDNCNGSIDEGCSGACQDNQTISCGSDVGACTSGWQVCQNGVWSACNATLPTTETCNGVDDDCDNVTDNGLNVTATCGVGACLRSIAQTCVGGYLTVCVPGTPTTETCNGADDDCDGTIDNGLVVLCGSGTGECTQGTSSCVNGAWSACSGGVTPTKEVCDLKDNDCDGMVDEDNICTTELTPPCQESWLCGNWTTCITSDVSTRDCVDLNACNSTTFKPAILRTCGYVPENTSITPLPDIQSLYLAILGTIGLFVCIAALIARHIHQETAA